MPDKKRILTLARCLTILLFLLLFSVPQSSLAQENVTALMSPQNLSAAPDPVKQKVLLSWSPVSGAAGYNVYRKLTSAKNYSRINFSLIKSSSYSDSTIVGGKSYDYIVRSVDSVGNESADSIIVGAPNMVMDEAIKILHEGEVVDVAMPGDAITYIIDYANNGYGIAKDVSIVHAIPKGTTILAGTAKANSIVKVKISYFDKKKDAWVDKDSQVIHVFKWMQ